MSMTSDLDLRSAHDVLFEQSAIILCDRIETMTGHISDEARHHLTKWFPELEIIMNERKCSDEKQLDKLKEIHELLVRHIHWERRNAQTNTATGASSGS